MTAVLDPPTIKEALSDGVLLHNVSWSTYESLLRDHPEIPSPHFTYDRGDLLIMVLSADHERINDILNLLINLIAEEFEIESQSFGSMTHKRKELKRGFEPDSCFYFKNETQMRGKKRLNLSVDPPPDLVLEIDITHPSIKKLSIFAAFGITEVWRFDGEIVEIHLLEDGEYTQSETSAALPLVTADIVTMFVQTSLKLGRLAWVKSVRCWAQQQREAQ